MDSKKILENQLVLFSSPVAHKYKMTSNDYDIYIVRPVDSHIPTLYISALSKDNKPLQVLGYMNEGARCINTDDLNNNKDNMVYGYYISWEKCVDNNEEELLISQPHTFSIMIKDQNNNKLDTETFSIKVEKNGYVFGYFDSL